MAQDAAAFAAVLADSICRLEKLQVQLLAVCNLMMKDQVPVA